MVKSVKSTNFQSWETLEFNVDQGVTQIKGQNLDDGNSEGSGKSSVINAICWGLFGCLPKDVNTDQVIRYGAKSCSVEVTLDSGLKIVRTRKPNDLYLYDPNKKDEIRGKDARETQKLIENILGLSFETFMQSVYFAQNYPKKFIAANEADKAKILSEIQQLEVFDKARKLTQANIRAAEVEQFTLEKDYTQQESILAALEKKQAEFEMLKSNFLKEKEERILSLKQNIEDAQMELKTAMEKAETVKEEDLKNLKLEYEKALTLLQEDQAKLKVELLGFSEKRTAKQRIEKSLELGFSKLEKLEKFPEQLAKTQEYIKNEKNKTEEALRQAKADLKIAEKAIKNPEKSNCPTCGQAWDGNLEHYKKEITKIKIEIEELQEKIVNYTESEKDHKQQLADNLKEIEELTKELTDKAQDLENMGDLDEKAEEALKNKIEEYQKDIGDIRASMKRLDSELVELDRLRYKIGSIKSDVENFKKDLKKEEANNSKLYDDKIEEAEIAQKDVKRALKNLAKELTELRRLWSQLEVLKNGFKEVKSFVFQGMLKEINRKANEYLAQLFEQTAKIRFHNEGDSGEISKIHVEIELDGVARSLGSLSGGQYRRFQLAVDFALSDIVSARNPNVRGFMVIDEGFHNLSLESKQRVLELLRGRKGSVLLIEHDAVFEAAFDQKFEVELKDGISRSVNNGA